MQKGLYHTPCLELTREIVMPSASYQLLQISKGGWHSEITHLGPWKRLRKFARGPEDS